MSSGELLNDREHSAEGLGGAGLGPPLAVQALPLWVFLGFVGASVAAAVAFLILTPYARKEVASGALVPAAGLLSVSSPQPGVVTAIHVRPGQSVQRSAELMTISVASSLEGGRTAGEMLGEAADLLEGGGRDRQRADELLLQSQRQDLAARQDALNRRQATLKRERELATQRLKMASDRLAAMEPLLAKGFISALQVQSAREYKIEADLRLTQVDEAETEFARSRGQLEAEALHLSAKTVQAKAAAAESDAAVTQRRVEALGAGQIVLRAPQSGRVASLQARPGVTVAPGANLAVILPEGSALEAELLVSSRAIGFIRPGQTVRIMYAGYPYQKFGMGRGVVTEVAAAPISAAGELRRDGADVLYPVRLKLAAQSVTADGRRWPLVPAMKVTGAIELDRRSAFDWLFEPVIGLRARTAG